MKSLEELKQNLESKMPGVTSVLEEGCLVISKNDWLEVAKFLKSSPLYSFDYLSSVTGVDYPDRLEAVYHLYSIEKKIGPLTVKVRTDRQKGEIPSVTPVWRSAEFQEREAFDLLGIHFTGHPDLRRILMWEGFAFHPLRKDYVAEND